MAGGIQMHFIHSGFFFVNIYLRCFKISSVGAGYRYSILRDIEYKITFIVIIFESIVSSSSRFMPLVITYDVLFQGPKVTNYTQRRNICIRWAIDMILCDRG